MRTWRVTLFAVATSAMLVAANSASMAAVAVGNSSLIETLDYSDTFTQFGGPFDGRIDGIGIVGTGLNVENTHGNAASTWHATLGTSYTHTSAPGSTNIPAPIADNGAGSDTGIVVNAGGWPDYGFAYGLRDKFVVQYDAIQTYDRIDIGIGPTQGYGDGSILEEGTLWGFFRSEDGRFSREVAVYHAVHEYDTGLESGIANYGKWHNYAIYFDLLDSDVDPDGTGRRMVFFVDEEYLGQIDIDTFADGALAGAELSNAFVNVGFAAGGRGDVHYFDNLQVGLVAEGVVPPPPMPIPGDTNNDGYVDQTDAETLATNWGMSIEPAGDETKGDFNADGVVDMLDASIMAANWTGPPPAEAANVPEPSAVALLLGCLATLMPLWRRRG